MMMIMAVMETDDLTVGVVGRYVRGTRTGSDATVQYILQIIIIIIAVKYWAINGSDRKYRHIFR